MIVPHKTESRVQGVRQYRSSWGNATCCDNGHKETITHCSPMQWSNALWEGSRALLTMFIYMNTQIHNRLALRRTTPGNDSNVNNAWEF